MPGADGFATEAGGAAMRHVLETLGRSRVVAIIDIDNQPSKRVAERLGMQYEGRYTGTELDTAARRSSSIFTTVSGNPR